MICLEVALSTYAGLFIAISLSTFILFTVASFFLFGISQMIKKRELVVRNFVKKNFQRVGIFSLLNGLSSTAISAWWLSDFVPKELGGAVVGAIVSVVLTQLFSGRSERERAVSALRTELKINGEIADRVLKSNRNDGANPPVWYEFIPFMETAWGSFVEQGMLSKLKQETSEDLSRAYAMMRSANFQAQKIQMGTFKKRDAEAYTNRVKKAKRDILSALDILRSAA